MKVLAASLAVLLLVAACSLAEADPRVSRNAPVFKIVGLTPNTCCFTYISRPIPSHMIRSAYWSSSSCPMPAVILVTRKGKEMCADPKAPWVQKYLQDLQELQELPEN